MIVHTIAKHNVGDLNVSAKEWIREKESEGYRVVSSQFFAVVNDRGAMSDKTVYLTISIEKQ